MNDKVFLTIDWYTPSTPWKAEIHGIYEAKVLEYKRAEEEAVHKEIEGS